LYALSNNTEDAVVGCWMLLEATTRRAAAAAAGDDDDDIRLSRDINKER